MFPRLFSVFSGFIEVRLESGILNDQITQDEITKQLSDLIASPIEEKELYFVLEQLQMQKITFPTKQLGNLYFETTGYIFKKDFAKALDCAEYATQILLNSALSTEEKHKAYPCFICLRAVCCCALGLVDQSIHTLSLVTALRTEPMLSWATSLHNRFLLRLSPPNTQAVIANTQAQLKSELDPSAKTKLCADMAVALALCGKIEQGREYYEQIAPADPEHPFLPILHRIY